MAVYEGPIGSGRTNEQPIICDGTSELGLALSSVGGTSGVNGGLVFFIIAIILAAIIGAYCYFKKKQEEKAPPKAKAPKPLSSTRFPHSRAYEISSKIVATSISMSL